MFCTSKKTLAALGFIASVAFLWTIIGINCAATSPSKNNGEEDALSYFADWWPALHHLSKVLSLAVLSISCGAIGAGLGYSYGVFCYEAPEEERRLMVY